MHYTANLLLDWIANYFWPFTRISSMMMAMTFFGARFVSPKIRLYLALAITFAVLPVLPKVPQDIELLSLAGFIVTTQQLIIGVAMGLVTQFITQIFVLLGQILGMQSSLGFASMVDPANGQNTPVLGQFYMFLAILLFLATDGHLEMLNAVVVSFKTLPIGEAMLQQKDYYQLAGWFGHMFKAGVNMALAGVIALLTVNLSFGVMTRAAPQLNIFSLGFSFALLLGLAISWFIVLGIVPQYEAIWQVGLDQVCSLIRIDC
ncbi:MULTISPECIES: flagellar biosynthetic protein FliR [unclassified Photobacterium]|uniref:flagellar biosynthetic protein FliR n=1 Tax=unclassified Photobacterium TaxID=2628852 RepID=UPI000D15FE2B|nr:MULTISPECIES: flagellar biosynthetic protein FliR [unclassified Photobacterium]PSV28771.1 flagellar biosynthetic protein FliR [Photobacterium sp. GB-56]PSV33379.1 flagellar biosynthetic protein FliR [Photobacterium sp. GB-72]PSV39360.1 flagellar biosynthetic protein FliR [Photobacterium sp. GB-27]PSV40661.1 flagellar biosynthetic protein FliR [Photobacterium sp. GB-210]PSV46537.1 flagellar biosynthetic protein FliR [Photobacterium sp. GB-36]